jgi:hypothetical protein
VNLFWIYCWVEIGLLCSLGLPFARTILRPLAQAQAQGQSWLNARLSWIWHVACKYAPYLGATLLLAFIGTMLSGRAGYEIKNEYDAFFVGFIIDTIIAKLFREKPIGIGPAAGQPAPQADLAAAAEELGAEQT